MMSNGLSVGIPEDCSDAYISEVFRYLKIMARGNEVIEDVAKRDFMRNVGIHRRKRRPYELCRRYFERLNEELRNG